ncbi:hypothetical protein B484DRAFT_458573 [Ochromonadaceae sp. CCMP2298]|nr:hypothetical protein B484DRAFT_458573 [Ochromonadaceae sp. CCMP2298]
MELGTQAEGQGQAQAEGQGQAQAGLQGVQVQAQKQIQKQAQAQGTQKQGTPTRIPLSALSLSQIRLLIVCYGNGLPSSLLAADSLIGRRVLLPHQVLVVDSPYLSAPPADLLRLLEAWKQARGVGAGEVNSANMGENAAKTGANTDENTEYMGANTGANTVNTGSNTVNTPGAHRGSALVLADVCKEGPGMPFAAFATALQRAQLLPSGWGVVGGQATYHPLSRTLTFLSAEDIEAEAERLLSP